MAKQTFKQFEDNDSGMTEVGAKAKETMEKIKFRDQKQAFDKKIEELAAQAAEFYAKYGEEDWRTSLLINFLDLSLQMKDIIEVVTAFNVANEIIFHSMNLMNTSLQMSNGMMMQMATPTNSAFKQKLLMRKAMRNNRKTVKNMIEQMKTSIQMASLTAGMYEDLSASISGIMEKMNGKREKAKAKKAKSKSGAAMSSASNRGLDMVKNLMAEKGVSAPTPPPAPAAPSAPSSGTPGDSGLDGLL